MLGQLLRNAKERLRLFLSERGRRARVLRDRLRRQPGRIDPSFRFFPGYGYGEREARGLELLKEWLTPEQIAQYDAKSYFEVTGCHSGKRYRISHGTSMNIHELDGAPAVRGLVGALRPKVTSSQAMSCWHRKLRWRPTSVARWPWRTDFSCFVDFIAPDGRTPSGRRRA